MEPSTAGRLGPARRFAGRRPLRFAFFFALSFSGKGSSGAACSAFCRAQAVVVEDSGPPRPCPVVFRVTRKEYAQRKSSGSLRICGLMPRRLPCLFRPHWHRIRRYLCLGAASSASDARLWNQIRRFGLGRGVFNVCARPCLLGIGHGFFVCLFSSSGCGIPHADAPRPQRARRCGIGAPFPASGSAFPEPGSAFPAPDAGRPSGGEGLGGGSRSGFFSCANRGSGCFKECFLENQCIMEGSHRLSCGKATMRPTHTNRPTT